MKFKSKRALVINKGSYETESFVPQYANKNLLLHSSAFGINLDSKNYNTRKICIRHEKLDAHEDWQISTEIRQLTSWF